MKSLQSDTSVIMLPADKGNVMVVIDKLEYSGKLTKLVGDGSYSKSTKEPTVKTERNLSQILNMNNDYFQ